MRLTSLRARLFAAIALVALLSLALALAIGASLTRRAVERNTLRDVSAQFDLLAERERERDPALLAARARSRSSSIAQDERVVPVPLDGSSPLLPPDRAARLRRGAQLDGTLESDGDAVPLRGAARRAQGLHAAAAGELDRTRPGGRTLQGLIVAAVATAALAALIAFLLARAIARPVRRVAEATRGLASAVEHPPLVPVEGPRELAQLAESFNEIAVALAKAREAERAFLLSVSHELKTPLTAIRGYAEGLQEGALPADEAAATIVARVAAARAARRRPARPRPDEQGGVQRPPRADRPGRDRARGGPPLRRPRRATSASRSSSSARAEAPALGDADRVLQVVSNLVENALRLTPAGGTRPHRRGARRAPRRGHGPGLEAEELRARVRALLPLLPLRPRAPGRHRPRARDREGARRGHGRLGRRVERARRADRLHRAAAASSSPEGVRRDAHPA